MLKKRLQVRGRHRDRRCAGAGWRGRGARAGEQSSAWRGALTGYVPKFLALSATDGAGDFHAFLNQSGDDRPGHGGAERRQRRALRSRRPASGVGGRAGWRTPARSGSLRSASEASRAARSSADGRAALVAGGDACAGATDARCRRSAPAVEPRCRRGRGWGARRGCRVRREFVDRRADGAALYSPHAVAPELQGHQRHGDECGPQRSEDPAARVGSSAACRSRLGVRRPPRRECRIAEAEAHTEISTARRAAAAA